MRRTNSRDATGNVSLCHADGEQGWQYTVDEPKVRAVRPKAYADNFAYTRVGRWAH